MTKTALGIAESDSLRQGRIVFHNNSTARSDKLRKACLILLNANSIGLRSGEYGGR